MRSCGEPGAHRLNETEGERQADVRADVRLNPGTRLGGVVRDERGGQELGSDMGDS